MRYKVVLYNAGKRIKCLGIFDKYREANELFQLNLANNLILFPKLSSWNGGKTDFELVLLGPPGAKNIDHVRDENGRKIDLKASDGHTIRKIAEYQVEETFTHKNSNKKYQFKEFVKEFVVGNKGDKTFYCVNNKVVIWNFDTDAVDVFALKNKKDAVRLNKTIKEFCFANKLYDHLFFDKVSKETKIDLYDKVESDLGISRKYMSRCATH